jgi:hypothetical protein
MLNLYSHLSRPYISQLVTEEGGPSWALFRGMNELVSPSYALSMPFIRAIYAHSYALSMPFIRYMSNQISLVHIECAWQTDYPGPPIP